MSSAKAFQRIRKHMDETEAAASKKYNDRYNNYLYNLAVSDYIDSTFDENTFANMITDAALALCGSMYYRCDIWQWSSFPNVVIYLSIFVED